MQRQIGEIPSSAEAHERAVKDTLPASDNEDMSLDADDIKRLAEAEAEAVNAQIEEDENALSEATAEQTAVAPETETKASKESVELGFESWFSNEVVATVEGAIKSIDATEAREFAKINKGATALDTTLEYTAESFKAPSAILEDGKSFVRDVAHATVGTAATGTIKRAFNWLLGKSSEAPQEREHFGIVGETLHKVPDLARTFPEAALSGISNIARDVAMRFDTWSPDTLAERARLAKDMEQDAKAAYDRIVAGIHAERNALYRSGFSEKNKERLAHLDDVDARAKQEYEDALAAATDVAPSTIETILKVGTWSTASVSLDVLSLTAGLGGIVEEAGKNFLKGVRQERKQLLKERNGVLEIHENTAISGMEKLGDFLMTKAAEMNNEHHDFLFNIHKEASLARHREAVRKQGIIEQRIAFFTEKTKLTKTDFVEIHKLTSKLTAAREGLLGTQEIDALIEQARNLGDSRKEDEQTLMGYIAGRAINSLKKLTVLPPEVRKALITELQENPSPEALKVAETALYVALDENASIPGVTMSEDDKEHARLILRDLKESIQHATETYNASVGKISGEIAKAFQTANRELKKAAAEAEMERSEEKAAA